MKKRTLTVTTLLIASLLSLTACGNAFTASAGGGGSGGAGTDIQRT